MMYNSQKIVFLRHWRSQGCVYPVIRNVSTSGQRKEPRSSYDAIIIGGGHNGLIAAAYLQKAGRSVCVLERRHVLGGAAVTEEIVPGFKFSRCSYVLSLLRPHIYTDLELKRHGLKIHIRDPHSFTPMLEEPSLFTLKPRSLLMGSDPMKTHRQIAQFSQSDAKAYPLYEEKLNKIVRAITPLLDTQPINIKAVLEGSWAQKRDQWSNLKPVLTMCRRLGKDAAYFYEFLTSPATKMLKSWFESEPLIATLATDAVIGAMMSPHSAGSSYVLLHHVMGEIEGRKGAWGYVEGGMGALSDCIAKSALERGAEIYTNSAVSSIRVVDSKVSGVVLKNGQEIRAKLVLSNATPRVTYLDLVERNVLDKEFVKELSAIDYTSPVTKINVAVNKLPNFIAAPNGKDNAPLPHHQCTIHLNCENTQLIHDAFLASQRGEWSTKPVLEMTIPSSKDNTLAPTGKHVVLLFTMYTPYTLSGGRQWDEENKNLYADCVFDSIEQYAPGFKDSVIDRDILTPPDLERIFGLTGGNIFHGAMALDQLFITRPTPMYAGSSGPIRGLHLCGSGAHPGGGVMGAPGYLAAMLALKEKV